MFDFIEGVFKKSFFLGILLVILLLMPMSWPFIILIMSVSAIATFIGLGSKK
jgi:hypothetical protein